MSKKEIIFYSKAFYTGGMENAVYHLIRLMNKTDKYHVRVLTRDKNIKTEKMLNKLAEISSVSLLDGGIYTCDVLINCSRSELEVDGIFARKIIHWFSSSLIENIDKIKAESIVVSQSKWHHENLFRLGISSTTIGNPLDVDYIVEQAQKKTNIGQIHIKYLIVSRLSTEKGFDRAIKFMLSHKNDILYVIGGDTFGQGENIKTRLRRQLQKRVVFLGELDNPYPYMKQADYLLFLSDHEIYGLVSEEAHILGTQVIFNRYETAQDQFINNFDAWYDEQIPPVKKIEGFDLVRKMVNDDRFKQWEAIINA